MFHESEKSLKLAKLFKFDDHLRHETLRHALHLTSAWSKTTRFKCLLYNPNFLFTPTGINIVVLNQSPKKSLAYIRSKNNLRHAIKVQGFFLINKILWAPNLEF